MEDKEKMPFEYKTNEPTPAHSFEQSFRRLQKRIESSPDLEVWQKRVVWWKWTAVACLLLLVATIGYQVVHSDQAVRMKVISVAAGNSQQFVLPDGTQVWVNAESRLVYPENFTRGSREVYLTGEAYFEVVKESRRPFVVRTDLMDIKVLGTKFNVKSYPNEPTIETSLLEGAVWANSSTGSEGTTLKPNQQLVLRKADGKLSLYDNINMRPYMAWIEGKLYFNQASIEEIGQKLERAFGVRIYIESERLRARKFTGKFDQQETVEDILEAIKLTTPCSYHRQGNAFVMKDK